MLNVNHHNLEHLFLNLIIPILVGVCMVLPGCDSTDDQPVPSRPPVFVDNPDRDPLSKKVAVNDARQRIVAFGDSLTAGLGVPVEESYPSRLQRRIDAAGYPYRVINAGVSGDTTAGALRRLNWCLKSQPSIVIIELGANDGLRGKSVDHISENLRQIIQRLS